ncbi:MAG TPA: lyase family protein [Candidatus Nanoarchaeia archaeon]|nr:lyase family protein [Candidatus Nanoarchaeia archaeon]
MEDDLIKKILENLGARGIPKKFDVPEVDSQELAAGRYGTEEMCGVFNSTSTVQGILDQVALSTKVVSKNYPEITPEENAQRIAEKATIGFVSPEAAHQEEATTHHDVIAVTNILSKQLLPEDKPHVGRFKTSADSTETAKGSSLKTSLDVYIPRLEDLRDILIEKAVEGRDIITMAQSHELDAVAESFGKVFVHFAERIQFRVDTLAYHYKNSLFGKWSDATGSYHNTVATGVDGRKLESDLMERLGLRSMIAASQTPPREALCDIGSAVAISMATLASIAREIKKQKSDDVDTLWEVVDEGTKGSSAMPHKDIKGGNPSMEERIRSLSHMASGYTATLYATADMAYARDLEGSASDRIVLGDLFKIADYAAKLTANILLRLTPHEERIRERIERTQGVTTASRVVAYLTDPRLTENPLSRREAHDLIGKLAKKAYTDKVPFYNILLASEDALSRLGQETIKEISNPLAYIGESKQQVLDVAKAYYGKRTLG